MCAARIQNVGTEVAPPRSRAHALRRKSRQRFFGSPSGGRYFRDVWVDLGSQSFCYCCTCVVIVGGIGVRIHSLSLYRNSIWLKLQGFSAILASSRAHYRPDAGIAALAALRASCTHFPNMSYSYLFKVSLRTTVPSWERSLLILETPIFPRIIPRSFWL